MQKEQRAFWWKHGRLVLFSVLLLLLAAQLNMNLFGSAFKISLASILLPVLVFLFGSFPLLPVVLLTAPGVYLSRVLYAWLKTGTLDGVWLANSPEILFYLVYGLCLYFYFRQQNFKISSWWRLLPLALWDYLANLTEMLCRVGTGAFVSDVQLSLILVAAIRMAVVWLCWVALEYYGFALLKQEHAQRYRRLLLLISKLKGEVVWMDKNAAIIENTMNTSYQLYEHLKEAACAPALADEALTIAKDIHEIKKEYNLIRRGISEALDQDLNEEGMYLKEMLQLLQDSLTREAASTGKTVSWNIQVGNDFYTRKQYYLLSVLRNLFHNAVEAAVGDQVSICFIQKDAGTAWRFYISDAGKGIKEEYRPLIFRPGFSTKINYATGEVKRGLGLSLVHDLVEQELMGRVWVDEAAEETTFVLEIPKEILEG